MARSGRKLKIFAIDEREARSERAHLINALSAIRPVEGRGPWLVSYVAADASEAIASCADDLSAIDPGWLEFLDFVVIAPVHTEDRLQERSRGG